MHKRVLDIKVMIKKSELEKLISKVYFEPRYNAVEGTEQFRFMLEKEDSTKVLEFLKQQLSYLEGKVHASIIFVIAEHYRKTSQLEAIQQLYYTQEALGQSAVLNALWGKSGPDRDIGSGIVALAIEAMQSQSAEVRVQACFVIMNQSDYSDITKSLKPLTEMLKDPDERVRLQAERAVGNISKHKYDLSNFIPLLKRNLKHKCTYVREDAAWALWQMVRKKYDISMAINDLSLLLADDSKEVRKQAIGVLLNFAKKSNKNATLTRKAIKTVSINMSFKEIERFTNKLNELD
jgi:hypothetical protein